MGESDDDNAMGRKRREKPFRGERDESGSNSRGSRDHWRSSKKLHHGPSSYSKNYGHSPIRYRDHSPNAPYAKRVRRDWDSQENNSYHYPLQTQMYTELQPVREESPTRYAQMLSFKAFLAEQEDHIDESEAASRYTEYKTEFRKNQISDFFLAHKEEEWFRLKYDPILKQQQNDKEREVVRKRLKLCMDMYKEGAMDDIRLDMSRCDDLLRFLETVVKRLESCDQDSPCSEHNIENNEGDDQTSRNGSDAKIDNNLPATDAKEDAADDASDLEVTGGPTEERPAENDEEPENSHEETPMEDRDDSEAHKTSSIFIRFLPGTVTQEEIERLCRKYEGFKRATLAEPQPDRRFTRRGWLTFKHGVDIKKICWEFNSAKIWPCEVGAIVNRELTRRIRPVDAITNYAPVVQSDLDMAIKMSKCLDTKWSLWSREGSKDETPSEGHSDVVDNPFIKEAEQALTTMQSEASDDSKPVQDANPSAKLALDRLLIYLRLVHSIDYYNAVEYQLEDHMPNRCGILHVRSCNTSDCAADPSKSDDDSQPRGSLQSVVTKCSDKTDEKQLRESISQWLEKCKERLAPFIETEVPMDIELARRLGLKDEEEEVERFITQNTVKVLEDRWSCPLSGKKFKGPEFVRKHIFNKHQDKIDKVRRDVACFNNYVLDSKRPQLPEQIITRPMVPAPMKMGVAFHQECQGFSKHHGSSQSPSGGYHASSGWSSGGGSYPYGGRSRGQRMPHSGNEGLTNQGGPSARDGRDREAVRYDISYSELEESNFPC